ncbi:MAG: hypothetical protein ACRD5L_02525 [Bryobacteraceae bacterium]
MRHLLLLFALGTAALAAAQSRPTPQRPTTSAPAPAAVPTDAERRGLIERVLANQHLDDQALPLFQRVERSQIHGREGDSGGEDRTTRIIPSGVGSARIVLEDHGRQATPAEILAQMFLVERQLAIAVDPSNPQTRRDREKYDHRMKDRNDLANSIRDAYIFTWMGREVRDGRTLAKFHLDPNPNFKATSRYTDMLRHAVATMWVDESSAQLVRLDGELVSDISIAAGIVGKVYRGGHIFLEQTQVEPGLWFPRFVQYDFTVRKVFFIDEIHERIESSHYVRVGSPDKALAAIRAEISAARSQPSH